MGRSRTQRSIGMRHTVSGSATSRSNISSKKRGKGSRAIGHVICIDNSDYLASLEKGKVYRVLRDAGGQRHGLLRVIDESGEDYLYPESRFSPVKLSRQAARALAVGA